MTIDQNHLLMVQHGKISAGRAKELIEAEIQKELEELGSFESWIKLKREHKKELEALAKECIGEEDNDFYYGDPPKYAQVGYNQKRQEVIEAFKRRGI
jgi:hypothetical protein